MRRKFRKLIEARWALGFFVCVGLDSNPGRLPIHELDLQYASEELEEAQAAYLAAEEAAQKGRDITPLTRRERRVLAEAMLAFNKLIIDQTHDIVAAYKPNSAFYESLGSEGWWALEETLAYIHEVAPTIPVILDCKRGDIGNTNIGYVMATAMFDAVTIHVYLGPEATSPLLANPKRFAFAMCRTSNPDAGYLQDLMLNVAEGDGKTITRKELYKLVARQIADPLIWNGKRNCGAVVGATAPKELKEAREELGDDVIILIPGVGEQGGTATDAVINGRNKRGDGYVINCSRAVIFPKEGTPRQAVEALNTEVAVARAA